MSKRERMMALTDIAHVNGAHVEIEGQPNGTVESVVVVDTDLELDGMHPDYDKSAVDRLMKDLFDHVKANPHHAGRLRVRTHR